jgi:hypothetical protein
MRKIYTLITAVALAATISASASITGPKALNSTNFPKSWLHNAPSALVKNDAKQPLATTTAAQKAKAFKVPTKAPEANYITEAPEGRTEVFYRNSYGYSYSYFGLYDDVDYGSVGEVTFTDNGEVYFKNPFSTLETGTYLKGTIDADGIITVSFPQAIYAEEYYGTVYDYFATNMKYDEDEDWYVAVDEPIKFEYKDGEIKQLGNEDGEYLLGLISYYEDEDDDGNPVEASYWVGYGDTDYEFLPMTDTYVEVPTNSASKQYAITYGEGSQLGEVVTDGGNIYIKGLVEGFDDAWVKGTIADNKISIPSGQLIGVDYNHFIYFWGGTSIVKYYEDYDFYYTTYDLNDAFELTYDAESDTYTAVGENEAVIANIGKEVQYTDFAFVVLSLTPQGDITESIPENPVITDYMPYDEDAEYGYFAFDLPNYDADGNVLPKSKLYYNFLVDGEPYTLYPDEYISQTEEEITDIPYSYTDGYDVFYSGISHTIYFYIQGFETIGVQTTYVSSNGKEYKTDAVVIDAAGAKDVISNAAKQVVSESFYDLTGRAVSNPQNGLFIKKTNYADGSSTAIKEIRK